MEVPPTSDPIWEKVISGQKDVNFTFLGVKILLGRLQSSGSGASMPEKVQELHDVFVKNCTHPKIQNDLEAMIS